MKLPDDQYQREGRVFGRLFLIPLVVGIIATVVGGWILRANLIDAWQWVLLQAQATFVVITMSVIVPLWLLALLVLILVLLVIFLIVTNLKEPEEEWIGYTKDKIDGIIWRWRNDVDGPVLNSIWGICPKDNFELTIEHLIIPEEKNDAGLEDQKLEDAHGRIGGYYVGGVEHVQFHCNYYSEVYGPFLGSKQHIINHIYRHIRRKLSNEEWRSAFEEFGPAEFTR